jgi:hypothetical protein
VIVAFVLYALGFFVSFYIVAQIETIGFSIVFALVWPILAALTGVLLLVDAVTEFLENR